MSAFNTQVFPHFSTEQIIQFIKAFNNNRTGLCQFGDPLRVRFENWVLKIGIRRAFLLNLDFHLTLLYSSPFLEHQYSAEVEDRLRSVHSV